MRLRKKGMLLIAAVLLLASVSGCAGGAASANAAGQAVQKGADMQGMNGTITAEGEGKVQAAPDIAELRLSVTTEGADAEAVKAENTEQYNQAISFLKEQGIAETSIKTENIYLNPRYDYSGSVQTLAGYTMQTDLVISDIPVADTGALLDGLVAQGINGIQSISYLVSDYDARYQEALKLAVEHARGKAEAIANASGIVVGTAVSVTEYGADTSPRYTKSFAANRSTMMAEAAADQSMQVMPGSMEITARVNASFAIQ